MKFEKRPKNNTIIVHSGNHGTSGPGFKSHEHELSEVADIVLNDNDNGKPSEFAQEFLNKYIKKNIDDNYNPK